MKKILYLGTNPSTFVTDGHLIHYPVIKLIPIPIPSSILGNLSTFTHLIFTSKNSVSIFFDQVKNLSQKTVIAIGQTTAARLRLYNTPPTHISQEETQEGIIQLLLSLPLENAHILLPHSSSSRPLLENFLKTQNLRHQLINLYDTLPQKPTPIPDLTTIDEIVFTSPSTIHAFLAIFSHIPPNKKLTCIGPITQQALELISGF